MSRRFGQSIYHPFMMEAADDDESILESNSFQPPAGHTVGEIDQLFSNLTDRRIDFPRFSSLRRAVADEPAGAAAGATASATASATAGATAAAVPAWSDTAG